MDRVHKDALAARTGELAEAGAAVVVATHDTEFAAAFADRVVLLGQGVVIADGSPRRGARRRLALLDRGRARDRRRRAAARGRRAALRARRPEPTQPLDRSGARAVSWQLVLARRCSRSRLAAGFAWYEREQPPARVLALVAALAALAVVGRLAFAAFPNVKPTTDIVLFAGYALGAVPGFVVGRGRPRSCRTSSSRQGPWTPGRWPAGARSALAAPCSPACCAAASPAGSCWRPCAGWPASRSAPGWTSTSGRSPRTRTSTPTSRSSATSLPYNLAHAVGNVVFCLLIGPVFIRALAPLPAPLRGALASARRPPIVAALALALVLALPPARPQPRPAKRAETLARCSAQNKDGGFGAAPRPASSRALQRLGRPRPRGGGPQPARREAPRRALAGRLRAPRASARSSDIGEVERTVLRRSARRGLSPRDFGGQRPARRDPSSAGAATARSRAT